MAEERTSGIECGKIKIELRGVGKRVGLPPANFTGGDGHRACKTPHPGKNGPCPRGSGKKCKTCCGKGE